MEKKKVVGFSFGRKMSNTEVMIKEALLVCEKAGMEIQFLRCDDLNIHICTGCCSCVAGLMMGKGRGHCIHKDDDFRGGGSAHTVYLSHVPEIFREGYHDRSGEGIKNLQVNKGF